MKKSFIRNSKSILLIMLSSVCIKASGQPPSELQKLDLSFLEGDVPVYYSAEYEKRATYLQDLAIGASHYFQQPEIVGLEINIHLAVLDSTDWVNYAKTPYGIAHILSEPPTAVLAASENSEIVKNILDRKSQASERTLSLLDKMNISYNEAAVTFVDLIGFHEMGHLYAHHFGCHPWPEQKWLSEFVATYLAYAYMIESKPQLANLWEIMMDHDTHNTNIEYTNLADFENLYVGVGTENYGWYQAIFFQKVVEVYAESGISFLHSLKKSLEENPGPLENDPFRLKELDSISKGFTNWAKGPDGDLIADEN